MQVRAPIKVPASAQTSSNGRAGRAGLRGGQAEAAGAYLGPRAGGAGGGEVEGRVPQAAPGSGGARRAAQQLLYL